MTFIDQTKIFYGASAFLGVLAIFYFGFEYLTALSPFTITSILFALFLGFLGFGIRRDGNTAVLSYIFSAGAYIIGLMYMTGKFGFSSDQIMVSLTFSSAVFAGLGYLVTQKEFQLEKKQFLYSLIALTVMVGGLAAYDIVSEEAEYSSSFVDSVEMNETVDIGEATVEKKGFLPEESEGLRIQSCLYNATGHPVDSSGFSTDFDTMKFGRFSEAQRIEIRLRDTEIEGDVPVERAETDSRCEKIEEGPKIVAGPGITHRTIYD
ncbi:MAG: hypothetical protein ACLFTA_00860 [Candidatus Nanohaloarchaea archaeon]